MNKQIRYISQLASGMMVLAVAICFIILILVSAAATFAQQSFIHTVTKANTNCNTVCSVFEVPELAGNPNAVIFITPVDGSAYRHQIGAYYMYLKKWSVFNMDNSSMTEGARFKVEYYAQADEQHFTYVAAQQVAHFGVGYIDHTGLDNNPQATVRFTPHISSLTNGNYNRLEAKIVYDPNITKWIVANVNGQALTPGVAYNIGFNPGASATNANSDKTINPTDQKTPVSLGPVVTNPNAGKNIDANVQIPVSASPAGQAGGDLSGTYPNPTVIGLQGNPILSTSPTLGQTLSWNGTAWESSDENKPLFLFFQQSAFLSSVQPNVDKVPIPGLDTQSFTLTKSSHIIFYTTITAQNGGANAATQSPEAWLKAEILNSSGDRVADSYAVTQVAAFKPQTLVAVGLGDLPPGTYHTSVIMNFHVVVFGKMIIQIFPH